MDIYHALSDIYILWDLIPRHPVECTNVSEELTDIMRVFDFSEDIYTRTWVIIYIHTQRSKSLCAPDYHNTRLSCLTTWLNLIAWQPTARARGTLDSH
jgi:hypothetical protein